MLKYAIKVIKIVIIIIIMIKGRVTEKIVVLKYIHEDVRKFQRKCNKRLSFSSLRACNVTFFFSLFRVLCAFYHDF